MPVTVVSTSSATSSSATSMPSRSEIMALAASIEDVDGAPPLSDQTMAQLGGAEVAEFVATDGSVLVGYAQLADGSLEIASIPEAIDPLLDAAGADLLVWTHGTLSRLIGVLEQRGFSRERELHQLRRPLDELPADPPLAHGITVRAFVPGRDDEAWLALNAAAFVHHPEQGRWSAADLRARIAEPWFDAEGFLVAENGPELVGFHWTKVHPDGLGEVYVLAVAPAGQGLGLGSALLIRGLRDLAERRGCPSVLLYVDGDNPGALHLYERDGFTRYNLDVQWRSHPGP